MKSFIFIIFMLKGSSLLAQTTYSTNDPFATPIPLGYIGWDDNSNTDLNIRQNNTRRMRLTSVFWSGYNAAPSTPNASRMFLGINGNDMNPPFSMMHLGYEIDVDLQRQWMDVGTTYGAGADIMYTGLMQSPGNSNNALMVDAVLAWGCNAGGTNGPDNLRFLFITPTNGNPGDPATAQEGLETLRIAHNFFTQSKPFSLLHLHGLNNPSGPQLWS